LKRGKGIIAALEQPQLSSAWGRQRVALVKQALGDEWGEQLIAAAKNGRLAVEQRVRALDLMQLFGPSPPKPMLVELSRDRAALLRCKAASLMGLYPDEQTQTRLSELLDDKDLAVQRTAAEALVRADHAPDVDKLVNLLSSTDRHAAWSAVRALERIAPDQWATKVLENAQPRVFIAGSVALLVQNPKRPTIDAILERSSKLLKSYLTDDEFLNLMRVLQLALLKGEIDGDQIAELRAQLSDEYPSRDIRMNRELVRLLVYLQEPTLASRMVEQLNSDLPSIEKMQLLTHSPFLKAGWKPELKLEVLKAFEEARAIQGGHSFAGYVENVSRDFFASLDEEERKIVLAQGVKWPTSALSVLAKLPEHPSPEILAQIQKLDRQVKKLDSEAAKRLRIGICAVLGSSGDPDAMAYLRDLFESEPDRRVPIAMALAQHPDGENWPLLVRALSVVEGAAAQEVLGQLAQVDQVPTEPEAFRQVILRGLMLGENGSRRAIDVLEKWNGKQLGQADDPWDQALSAWQAWFTETYPNMPDPKLPVDDDQNHWTYQELLSFLTGPQASQSVASRGAVLFEKVQCVKCHRYGERGETVGPDLTNVSRRFQKKEILESILFPSQVISDQYSSQTVVTKDGKSYQGMVAPSGDGSLVVLQANGEKVVVAEEDVETKERSKVSAMPDGLLNRLSLEEIADLFAYLGTPPRSELARKPAAGKTRPR
ncbi:MAG TPA: HEAT repeat domain-containing protein, partial [Pirellulales bacterium]|nr:HEAT repeat domain-containing protein [Pirellulales bacterium]